MSDLLELAIAAHGGRERWSKVSRLTATTSIDGAVWRIKGIPGVLGETKFVVHTYPPRVDIDHVGKSGQLGVWLPDRIEMVTATGELIEQRKEPRLAYAGHDLMTPWSHIDAVYFAGYGMWTYLTTPFLFTLPGFRTEEVEPWESEDGDIWRRLKVTYPAHLPSHSPVQTFYFDEAGLLKRLDYSVEIMGGTNTAHYVFDPKVFDGIVVPTKRRVYSIGADNKPIRDRLAIAIDIHDLVVA